MEHFAIYSENCLSCKSLVDSPSTVEFKKCHYSQGNSECPASEVTIIIVGKALSVAQRVHEARLARDAKTEAKLMNYVTKQSDGFRSAFYSRLEKL